MSVTWVVLLLIASLAIGFLAGVAFRRRNPPKGWTFDDGEWFRTKDGKRVER